MVLKKQTFIMKTNSYWNDDVEQAVSYYITETDLRKRDKVFNKLLYPAFEKMIARNIKKYPFHRGNYTDKEVTLNILSKLAEHVIKFNPDKVLRSGKKPSARSYCETIVRCALKDHSKKSFLERNQKVEFDPNNEKFLDQMNIILDSYL
jgi:hypothetical protein